MKCWHGRWGNIPKHLGPCVATIGNFDGLHRGHWALIDAMLESARFHHLPSLVILFEPQPLEYFRPQQAPLRLQSLSEKALLLKQHGINHLLCLHFDAVLANCSVEAFVEEFLINALQVHHLWVGEDFRFGAQRQGNVAWLQQYAQQHPFFRISKLGDILYQGERISSTNVRQALHEGNMQKVNTLLGRPYSRRGRVLRGAGRGRQYGIPTANLYLSPHRPLPLSGVFIVKCILPNFQSVLGVANVGVRPTVDGQKPWLEVHLLDFKGDLYGQTIEVQFFEKIRNEQKFDSVDELIAQIKKDIEWAQHQGPRILSLEN